MCDNADLDFPPNETMAKLLALENRTGYTMQQFNGQRKFWNPNWNKPIPPRGCEVFVGKIPRDLFEDELVPVFEKIGMIYELRLMMDFSGFNRGYAFVAFTCHEHAQSAIDRLDNYEIRPGQRIGVCRSVDNCRLFVGGIPKNKTQQEILQAMCEISEDVGDVIVYPGSASGEQNRGFAFVEYGSHRAAAMARRKLIPGKITIFGNEIVVDWAEPEVDTNDNTSRIKNVYVRNLKITTPEYTVFVAFNAIRPGAIEKVKKIEDRDYAFVHFLRREDALFAIQMMNGQRIDGQEVQVSLAKPPSNKHDTNTSSLINNINNKNNGVASVRPPVNFDHMNEVARPTSLHQLPVPALQYGPPPFLPSLPDYASFLKTQPLRSLQPPPNPTAFQFKPARISIMNQPNMFNKPPPPLLPPPGPGGDSLNVLAQLENFKKNKEITGDGSAKLNLVPANNLHHISRIKCPVLLLDELSAIFNNGNRPSYSLFLDETHEATRYVYQVNFMGNDYVPPNNTYSSNPNDARIVTAQYVLKVIEPWLKTKIENVIYQNGVGLKQSTIPSSMPPFSPRNNNNASMYTQATYPGSNGISQDRKYLQTPALWKENCNPNQYNATSIGQSADDLKKSLYKNADLVNSSVHSGAKPLLANNSVYNLSDSLWNQLRLKDVSYSNLPEKKPDFSAVKSSASSLYSATLETPPKSPLLGGFKSSLF